MPVLKFWCDKCRDMKEVYRKKFLPNSSDVFFCDGCNKKLFVSSKNLTELKGRGFFYEVRD